MLPSFCMKFKYLTICKPINRDPALSNFVFVDWHHHYATHFRYIETQRVPMNGAHCAYLLWAVEQSWCGVVCRLVSFLGGVCQLWKKRRYDNGMHWTWWWAHVDVVWMWCSVICSLHKPEYGFEVVRKWLRQPGLSMASTLGFYTTK